MKRENPSYTRSWTKIRNHRAEYSYRQLIRQHDLSGVPTVLVRQFAAVSIRAHQSEEGLELPLRLSNGQRTPATRKRNQNFISCTANCCWWAIRTKSRRSHPQEHLRFDQPSSCGRTDKTGFSEIRRKVVCRWNLDRTQEVNGTFVATSEFLPDIAAEFQNGQKAMSARAGLYRRLSPRRS
jgi:hypothetical protein